MPMAAITIPPIWREGRVGLEAAALLRSRVFRAEDIEPAGDQPVLLIPGFLAGDDSLGLMTTWLRRTGHRTRSAGIRANVDCSEHALERLVERLEMLAETRGRRVAVIGQSRGGNFAKVLAARRPDLVSGIITLGSPQLDPLDVHPLVRAHVFAVGAAGTLGLRGLFTHSCLRGKCCTRFWDDLRAPLPPRVGYLSVYSRTDGIVNWRACLDPSAELLEVRSSHIGMAVSPRVYRAIAAKLADFRAHEKLPPGERPSVRRPLRRAA